MKRSGILLVSIMLFSLLIAVASAQMGAGAGQMGQAEMRGSMMQVDDFGQMDDRFKGFASKTFSQACSGLGVPIEDAISDLGLPVNMNRQMTIAEIEQQHGVLSDDIANYMVMHMRQTTSSVNARQMVVMRQEAMQGKRSQGMAQGLNFMMDGNSGYGNHVTYTFDESGKIRDFAISGDTIFDSIAVSDFDYSDENVQGANALYIGDSAIFSLHDNPTAVTQVKALADTTVTFDLADEVDASKIMDEANGTVTVKITKNNFEGYLIVCRDFLKAEVDTTGVNVEITDGTVTVDLVENSQVMFRATPMEPQYLQTQYQYPGRMSYMNQKINQEIARGKVGAELTIRERGNTSCLLNYTPVNLQLREAVRDRVVLNVASELKEGQVITINMDDETIDLTRPERIRLRYDGDVVARTDNIDELFAGGNRPLCYLMQENNTASMAMYIPEFSEHEIIIDLEPEPAEIETETEVPAEAEEAAPTPAFGAILTAAALVVAYSYRRR